MSSEMVVKIRCPDIPGKLTVELPGVSKGVTIGLDKFEDEQLDGVAMDYADALKKEAAKLRRDAQAVPDPVEERAEGAPEEETETPKKARAAKGKKGGHQAN